MNEKEEFESLKKMAEDFKIAKIHAVYIDSILEAVKEIHEPQKVVVPDFVADFYESIKEDFEDKVYDLCIKSNNNNDQLSGEVWWWFDCEKIEPIQTLVNMRLFGYVIEEEKEKLYTVEIPNPNNTSPKYKLMLVKGTNGVEILRDYYNEKRDPYIFRLTESEIKQDFDFLWQFAKEAE